MDHLQDLLNFPDQLREMKDLLETNRKRLKETMFTDAAISSGYNKSHATAAQQLSRALKELGSEMRAWIDKLETATRTLALDDKIELVIRFVLGLPKGTRETIYERMILKESEMTNGLTLVLENENGNSDSKGSTDRRTNDSGDLARELPEFPVSRRDPKQHVRDGDE